MKDVGLLAIERKLWAIRAWMESSYSEFCTKLEEVEAMMYELRQQQSMESRRQEELDKLLPFRV